MTINELVSWSHETAKSKGWWDIVPINIPEKLALVHSEISEALEDYRDDFMHVQVGESGKPNGFPVELADAIIRITDLCGYLGIDLEKVLEEKMYYNETRPIRHGGKKA